jgi:hypothetical protein
LISRSRIRNRSRPRSSPSCVSRFRACWATHAHRTPCHPEHVDLAGRHLDRKQHVHPPQEDRVHGEEVHRQHTRGLGARRNCRQLRADRLGAGSTPARRRIAHTVLAPIVSCIPAGTARRGCGDPPGRILLASRSTNARTSTATAGHAGAGRSSGAGPGRDASATASPAARTGPPRRTGQQPHQLGEHRPVRPVDLWPRHLASQHRDLVAHHEQLGV